MAEDTKGKTRKELLDEIHEILNRINKTIDEMLELLEKA